MRKTVMVLLIGLCALAMGSAYAEVFSPAKGVYQTEVTNHALKSGDVKAKIAMAEIVTALACSGISRSSEPSVLIETYKTAKATGDNAKFATGAEVNQFRGEPLTTYS